VFLFKGTVNVDKLKPKVALLSQVSAQKIWDSLADEYLAKIDARKSG
jgi:hypothetical protein